MIAATRAHWKKNPCGGSTSTSAQVRCSTCVAVYFQRYAPDQHQWSLLDVEAVVGSARADLLWQHHDGRIVIDEVKSGRANLASDAALTDQLVRLAEGGAAIFGEQFAGVRLVALEAPERTRIFAARNHGLVSARMAAGMKPR